MAWHYSFSKDKIEDERLRSFIQSFMYGVYLTVFIAVSWPSFLLINSLTLQKDGSESPIFEYSLLNLLLIYIYFSFQMRKYIEENRCA
ncbi:MAG: hypothetical protein U5K54_03995 [Cytophagales bacterium]|nr:hypothetical protein [Cytophagales bacterium]